MYWLLGYCGTCWLFGLFIARRWAGAVARLPDEQRALVRPVRAALGLTALVALAPVWTIFALLATLFMAAKCAFGQWRLRRVARRYREAKFEPVRVAELEPWIGESFRNHTGEFQRLGFDQLGNYRTKPEPVPVYNRYFFGVQGTVFGSVTALLESSACSLFSALEDGTYVETSAVDPFEMAGELRDDDLLHVVIAGQQPLPKLLEIHLQSLREEAERRSARVLAFAAEQLSQVSIFGQRRFWSWRQRCGENAGPVPQPELPVGEPMDVCGLTSCGQPLEHAAAEAP